MAPAANDRVPRSSREIRREARFDGFPSWTRGDESDDETDDKAGIRRQRRTHRQRRQQVYEEEEEGDIIRAETHQIDAATEFAPPQPTGSSSSTSVDPLTTTTDSLATTATGEVLSTSFTTDAVAEPTAAPTSTTAPVDSALATNSPPQATQEPESDSLDSGLDTGDSDSNSSADESSPVPEPTITSTEGLTLPSASGITVDPDSISPTEIPTTSPEAVRSAQQQHHRNVETALTVVGSVAGVILVIIGAFVFWRIMKRRRRNRGLDGHDHNIFPAQPSRRVRMLAKVPYLKERLANRAWINVDDSPAFDEKTAYKPGSDFDILGYLPDRPTGAMLPTRRAESTEGEEEGQTFGIIGAHYVDARGQHISQPAPEYDYGTTMQSQDQQQTVSSLSSDQQPRGPESRYSSGSSLSSAFGNGTHIPPTPMHPLHPPPAHHRNEPAEAVAPEPPTRRDTVYTQSSIASSVPRFRTINSWVRQQTGRIKDQPPMPEPRFTMMMQDGEEPRRVVVAPNGVGYNNAP